MTAPTEAEVRAHLEREAATMERSAETARMVRFDDSTHRRLAAIYRAAIALLDEARKDRDRLDWLEAREGIGIHPRVHESGIKYTHLTYFRDDRRGQQYVQGPESLRAAIDFARGEG